MNPVLMRAKALAFGNEEHPEAYDLDFVLRCGELTVLVGEQDSGRQALFDGLNGNCAIQRGMVLTRKGKFFRCRKRCLQRAVFSPRKPAIGCRGWN